MRVMATAVVVTCSKRWRSGREQHDNKDGKGDLLHAVIHIARL
jgi:hypothetical protein